MSVDVNGAKLVNARMVIPEYDAKFVLGNAEFVLHGSIGLDFAVGERGHLLASYHYETFKYGVSPIVYIPAWTASHSSRIQRRDSSACSSASR